MSGNNELGFRELLQKSIVDGIRIENKVILQGQYKTAYDLLRDAINSNVTPCLVGPPGVGKSLLARKVSEDMGRGFYEVFFDENMTPSRLIGAFDPALVVRRGRTVESFEPGSLMRAMVEGGLFVAHELNRATEFCQNSLIAPLEERHYHLYPFGMVKAHDNFSFIATQNPVETSGTYRLSRVLVDRIGCWIRMTYPDKETEIEILKVNAPAFNLSNDVMEKIYNIVNETRNNPDLEIPASPRAGIYLTRMVDRFMDRFDDIDDAIIFYAKSVLAKEMRMRNPNKTIAMVIDEILKKHLR